MIGGFCALLEKTTLRTYSELDSDHDRWFLCFVGENTIKKDSNIPMAFQMAVAFKIER